MEYDKDEVISFIICCIFLKFEMDPKNKRKSKARASPLRTNSKRGSVQGLVTSK